MERLSKWNKKGELPGWNVIIMLILGLIGLLIVIYIVYKSRGSAFESIDLLKNILGM